MPLNRWGDRAEASRSQKCQLSKLSYKASERRETSSILLPGRASALPPPHSESWDARESSTKNNSHRIPLCRHSGGWRGSFLIAWEVETNRNTASPATQKGDDAGVIITHHHYIWSYLRKSRNSNIFRSLFYSGVPVSNSYSFPSQCKAIRIMK